MKEYAGPKTLLDLSKIIRKELKQASRELEDVRYRVMAWLVRTFRIWR